MNRSRLIAFTFFFVLSAFSLGENTEKFERAYLEYIIADAKYLSTFSGDSKEALKSSALKLKRYAKRNNPIAQLAYGTALYIHDPKKNTNVFKKMLKKSAGLGYLPATRKLAMFYRSGKHFGKQPQKALELLEENASFGHERDLRVLVNLYKRLPDYGERSQAYLDLKRKLDNSINPDYQKGLAQSGSLRSQRIYGHMNFEGKYVKKNYFEAAYWLTLAIEDSENNQKAYDFSRLIYAKNELSQDELVRLSESVSETLDRN